MVISLKNIILMIKGFFIGIANIIPGVSGGTLAITMGIYEDLIEAISHFFKKLKKNIKFLIPVVIGAGLAIVLGSRVIEWGLDNFTLPTILFFAGLILGGLPMLFGRAKKRVKPLYMLVFLLTFASVMGITFLQGGNEVSFESISIWGYGKLFLVGIVAAATMIIPGISGSFMLMVMGYYEPILRVINEFTAFKNLGHNLLILVPFGLGVLIGIVAIAKIIEYLFKKYEVPTYYGIIGFVLASLVGIFTNASGLTFSAGQIIAGTLLLATGFGIAYKLGEK